MGFLLLPLVVLSFFLGIIAIERGHAEAILPSSVEVQASHSGQVFIAYRNAVMIYQRTNPTFVGSVSNADLAAQGSQFSSAFLATAGNAITEKGVSGRVITSFASLPPGAIYAAREEAEADASLGIAKSSNWTSFAKTVDYTPVPVLLEIPVPDGYVVSVVQIGN